MRLALPSKGRLRESCVSLLRDAGFPVGEAALSTIGDTETIEMRPRDAAAALAAGQLDGAFLSTDIVAEFDLGEYCTTALGFARCELILASPEDDGRSTPGELTGGVVATHLPKTAERYFARRGIAVRILPMGGSLEGVCTAGIADGIVDLRETGRSLIVNGLRVLDVLGTCEALFVRRENAFADLALRIEAVLAARTKRYVMLHVPPDQIDPLREICAGLAAPTVVPLSGRDDLVAVHLVMDAEDFWSLLPALRSHGATGIVATGPQAVLA